MLEHTVVQPALHGLETVVVGREVLAFDQLPSTSTLLREHALRGAAEGLVVLADEQTAGRGRRGRSWSAPPGQNLLQSVLLRPIWLPALDAFWLTIMAAVALRDALIQVYQLDVGLKWPNDVQIKGRKVAGILVDLEVGAPDFLRWAVIGCGINVNWHPDDPTLNQPTTSLAAELGQPLERAPLLRGLLLALDQRYLALRNGRRETLRRDWEQALTTLGQRVTVSSAAETFSGEAVAVASDGALRVRLADGSERRVMAADVSVRPQAQ